MGKKSSTSCANTAANCTVSLIKYAVRWRPKWGNSGKMKMRTMKIIKKNNDYLLCGEKTGTKLDKAKALGIKVITEQKLLKMLPQ